MNVLLLVLLGLGLFLQGAPVMHCCAGDSDVIYSDSFDDGAPLSANWSLIIDASINAGTGINGTSSLHSVSYSSQAGLYAEASKMFHTILDPCGNTRREFAVGGYWNGKNTHASSADGFHLIELKYSPDDPLSDISPEFAYELFAVQRWGRHIKVVTDPESISGDDVIIVTNVFDEVTFPFRYVEVIGSLSSFDEDVVTGGTGTNTDGWAELRIDGIPVVNGDDFEIARANYLNGIERPCVTPRAGDMSNLNVPAWNIVTISPQGDADCIYIKEKAAYCNDVELAPEDGDPSQTPDCMAPGPGGSTFNGQAQGQRTIHPGGFPVSAADYVAPTGGGISATASDPTAPQSLTGITTPQFSVDVTLTDGTVRRGSQLGPLPQAGRAPATWDILRISPIEFARSDRFGNLRAQTWSFDVADPLGLVRADLENPATRTYKRWKVKLFGESNSARLAGTARLSCARGRCISANTAEPLVVTFTVSDELSYPNSPVSLDRRQPMYAIGDLFRIGATAAGVLFTMDAPEQNLDRALPYIFGEASDERRLMSLDQTTALTIPVGIVQWIDIGEVLLKSGSERWRAFAICQYACKKACAAFGSNLHPDCPASVRLDPDLFSSEILLPNQGNWSDYFATPYFDVTYNGITVRVTLTFARGPRAQHHVDGVVPFSGNFWGKEHVGDSSGTLIDAGGQITQGFFHWPVLQRAKLGNEAMPTYSDGVTKFKTSSAVLADSRHAARRAGGYPGAMIIDTFKAGREWIAALLVSYDLQLVPANQFGQVEISTEDALEDLSSLPHYTDGLHIIRESFRTTSERSAELENARPMDFGPEPATGRLTGPLSTRKVQQSIDDWHDDSEPYTGDVLHLIGVYEPSVANDVVGRALARTREGMTIGEFTGDIDLFARKPGDLIRVTDYSGLGSSGWTDRVLVVDSIELNPHVSDPPQPHDLNVRVRWEDRHVNAVAPAGMVGGGETSDGTTMSRIGFRPVGNVADGTAWRVGNVSDGTAWRVG